MSVLRPSRMVMAGTGVLLMAMLVTQASPALGSIGRLLSGGNGEIVRFEQSKIKIIRASHGVVGIAPTHDWEIMRNRQRGGSGTSTQSAVPASLNTCPSTGMNSQS